MRAILFVNGVYSCYTRYKEWIESADCIVCADGGANWACQWGVNVDYLLGDLDSITQETLAYYQSRKVEIYPFPSNKDETDTQLALRFLAEKGADEIILIGSMGGRPDHGFSNLFTPVPFVRQGITILHIDTECMIWMVQSELQLEGHPGDIVSVFSVTEKSRGVTLEGFQYPLKDAELCLEHPYAVSNVLLGEQGKISVEHGILAVMHFR